MNFYQMGEIESRFAEIIWQKEPISSTELSRLALCEFGWKKSTVYTVIKRLCDKGIFKNEKGTVFSLVTKDEYYRHKSEAFISENFGGSLPAFLTAFTNGKKLSEKEVFALRELLNKYEG